MNVSRQAALLLVFTLLLGILLGALGAGAMRHQLEHSHWMMIQHLRGMSPTAMHGSGGRGLFADHVEAVIRPRDSAQRMAVRMIVERAAARHRAQIEELNRALHSSLDSMRAELAPVLDAEQRDRLERATKRLPPIQGPDAPGPGESAPHPPPPN